MESKLVAEIPWLKEDIPPCDIVISSRIRLARNIAGEVFPHKASEKALLNIVKEINSISREEPFLENSLLLNLDELKVEDRLFLMEKYLISSDQIDGVRGQAVLFDNEKSFSIMINEEDHLRLQCINPGLSLKNVWNVINKIDSIFDNKLKYAYSDYCGYLTTCPTNLGTGMRASVMMHLGALPIVGRLDKFFNYISEIGFTMRGIYGEGSEAYGNFYQISNQRTIGLTEEEIQNSIEKIANDLIHEEQNARKELVENKKYYFSDKVSHAYKLLNKLEKISKEKALHLLSILRIGILTDIINDVDFHVIDKLLWSIQPGHLNYRFGDFNMEKEAFFRAELIRENLN